MTYNEYRNIFSKFCKFVDETIFSEENVGSYVAFIVDSSFISKFCALNSVSEQDLLKSVRTDLMFRYMLPDIQSVKGILAIQLYAASKRKNSDGITEKNYRDRLSQILNWSMPSLQSWMEEYQEQAWESLYRWCDSHGFKISKCKRKRGAGRYVQYPVNQALRVFTDEDLKYIAAGFVDRNLQPGEDIQEKDFWRILSRKSIYFYIGTHHGTEVLNNSLSEEDYETQIFNFFLRWDGSYKRKNCSKSKGTGAKVLDAFLYMKDDFKHIDVRNSKLSLLQSFPFDDFTPEKIAKYYHFKRDGLILFKKDDMYENTWQETRYLENEEEGIALCVRGRCNHYLARSNHNVLFENNKVKIIVVRNNFNTCDLYTSKRFYSMEGGLKIGRNVYLESAGPILTLEHASQVWLDGKRIDEEGYLKYSFNNLDVGKHSIKIPGFKKIEFEFVQPEVPKHEWNVSFNRWIYDKDQIKWDSDHDETGCVGLDFSPYSSTKVSLKPDNGVLHRWSKRILFGASYRNETNIGIRIIK